MKVKEESQTANSPRPPRLRPRAKEILLLLDTQSHTFHPSQPSQSVADLIQERLLTRSKRTNIALLQGVKVICIVAWLAGKLGRPSLVRSANSSPDHTLRDPNTYTMRWSTQQLPQKTQVAPR
jgi:hypothetical protein